MTVKKDRYYWLVDKITIKEESEFGKSKLDKEA